MRVVAIGNDDSFREYRKTKFEVNHEERVLEKWFEGNPDVFLEGEGLFIIGRQVQTNLGTIIDLLALDREGHCVVVELKRAKTPRDTIAQALEYCAFVSDLYSESLEQIFRSYINDQNAVLAQYHRSYFKLEEDDIVVFNSGQRVVVAGQEIIPSIKQTARYLNKKGIRTNCLEFTYFEAEKGQRLMTSELVVDDKEATARSATSGASLPIVTRDEFVESLDKNGKHVFERILAFAEEYNHSINWGTKGFSLGILVGDTRIPICYGYPPTAIFKQSVYTALVGSGGLLKRMQETDYEKVRAQIDDFAREAKIFLKAGNEYKCLIDRTLSDSEIGKILDFIIKIEKLARDYLSEGN